MFVPASAVAGPVLLTDRSALAVTVVTAVALLLPLFVSAFVPNTVAVLLKVPVNPGLMVAVSVNCALTPEPRVGNEQVTLPVLPAPGSLQTADGPVFCTREKNVVPAGSGSLSIAALCASGPLLVMVMVHEIVFPAIAVAGPVFVTARSLVTTVSSVWLLLLSGLGRWWWSLRWRCW